MDLQVASTRGILAAVVIAALVSGCADSTTRPAATNPSTRSSELADVELSLGVQPSVGSPSQPIAIEASAVHTSEIEVWRCDGCGCGNGIRLTILGPDGAPVALTDPAAPVPLCPDVFMTWEINRPVNREDRFTGVLFEKLSSRNPTPTYPAPAGTYTVVADFSYSTSRDGPALSESRTTTFVWQP